MQYDHILIRYGEIALKGKNRNHFIAKLQGNIQHALRDFPKAKVQRTQGRLFVVLNGHDPYPMMNVLKHVFGIHSLSLAIRVENDLEAIKQAALFALNQQEIQTFKVSVKRVDKSFPYKSQDMNRLLGAHLLKHTDRISVDVHHPDMEVRVEIRHGGTYITSSVIHGSKGMPVGTAGKTLLLLSGGIDSPVAGYLAMKRGVELEAIHFHSPPFTSERAKQKVFDLADKLTAYGMRIKIHIVPFTNVQQAIFRSVPDSYGMTIMRRMMLRISERVCRKENILSMTTGESLGQVASQTMESMNVINEVTDFPVLRPLVGMDKDEIIRISRKIDTYDISIRPYEDCCTIFVPKSPKTRPTREKVNELEAHLDMDQYLDEAVENIEVVESTDEKAADSMFEDLF